MPTKASRVIRVIFIVLLAVAASGFLYLLINNFQFTRGPTVRIHFTSVGDLNTGAWVRKAASMDDGSMGKWLFSDSSTSCPWNIPQSTR